MANALAFAALAEPMRQAIVEHLAERPMAVGELAALLPVSRPAVSQHLKVLKDARLVRDEAAGHAPHLFDRSGRARRDPRLARPILGPGARRYAEAAEREEREMNVEAQRISPAPIRKTPAGQGEPAKGVRHVRRAWAAGG